MSKTNGTSNKYAHRSASELENDWKTSPRWKGITRDYTGEDVAKLRGSVKVEHTLGRMGSERLWDLMHSEAYVNSLGAISGNQAVQQVKAGLKAIYMSGWQVAADGNQAGQMYPDQSLYPADSVPKMVTRVNNALLRADQIEQFRRCKFCTLVSSNRCRCRSWFWWCFECF